MDEQGDSGARPVSTTPKRSARLLIVEDEHIVALDLRVTLEELGYQVVGIATSAAAAHAAAHRERPDLVLMDVRLKGDVDGIQIASLLRAELNVPVVFLTANADADTRQRALKTAPGGFLHKPFTEQALHSAIEVALNHDEVERGLRGEDAVLERESTLDPLTELHNRHFVDSALAREIELARHDQHAVGVIMMDLDHFKQVNDRYGQAAGDAVLRAVADILRSRLGVDAIAGRYSVDHLLVLSPGTSAFGCRILAEALRADVSRHVFGGSEQPVTGVTASFGVAAFPEDASNAAELLSAADTAMHRAKYQGRNCVVGAGRHDPTFPPFGSAVWDRKGVG